MHEYFQEENILHYPFFSGRGFHIFMKLNEVPAWELKSATGALRICHQYFTNEAKVQSDPKTRDVTRIARLPNTINMKSGLFCIPLQYEDLYLNRSEIEDLAHCQRFCKIRAEGEPVDLKKFDIITEFEYKKVVDNAKLNVKDEKLKKYLPPCILNALTCGECGYEARYAVITALRDLICSEEEVRGILERNLSERDYDHCVNEEHQLSYLCNIKEDYLCPSCDLLKPEGLCIEGCSGQDGRIYYEK